MAMDVAANKEAEGKVSVRASSHSHHEHMPKNPTEDDIVS